MTDAYGVYVHVPWCHHVCPYCAFAVERDRGAPYDAYVDRVLAEYAWRAPVFPGSAATVYLGGGTPSRLPPAPLRRLLAGLPAAPVELEANPEDVTPEWLAATEGVDRVSLGIQTFHPGHARRLARCAPDTSRRAAARVGQRFRTWSLDLMFALPGQTMADLDADLDALLALEPPHVSLYGLTYEPGTPFERLRARGRLTATDDDAWGAMYDRIVDRLEGAGIDRYEVSNFARPGHESRHNLGYWTDRPYMGLGPSAHGYAPDGARYANVPGVADYLAATDPTAIVEPADPDRRALDVLISTLRGRDGVDLARLEAVTGRTIAPEAIAPLVAAGLVRASSRIALTRAGFPLCDAILGALAEGLVPAPTASGVPTLAPGIQEPGR